MRSARLISIVGHPFVTATARLKLARHRPAEVVAGLLAGVLAGLGIYAA